MEFQLFNEETRVFHIIISVTPFSVKTVKIRSCCNFENSHKLKLFIKIRCTPTNYFQIINFSAQQWNPIDIYIGCPNHNYLKMKQNDTSHQLIKISASLSKILILIKQLKLVIMLLRKKCTNQKVLWSIK